MDFWRRTAGRSRRERARNEEIKHIMGAKYSFVDNIRTAQFWWYGHVQKMKKAKGYTTEELERRD